MEAEAENLICKAPVYDFTNFGIITHSTVDYLNLSDYSKQSVKIKRANQRKKQFFQTVFPFRSGYKIIRRESIRKGAET